VVEGVVQTQYSSAQSSSFLSPASISANYSAHSKSQTSLISSLSERLSSTPKPAAMPTPTAQQKSAKSKLSLRNPMSLLMRRRSSQALQNLADESLVSHRAPTMVPSMPDNYDPSIRGRIVHDFSAPRMNRNYSHNSTYSTDQTAPADDAERYSPPKIERAHTPIFHEHFDDDTSYEQSQAAIRAEQLANKAFVQRNSWQPPVPPARTPSPLPPVAKVSPKLPPEPTSSPPPAPHTPTPQFESSILSPVPEAPSPIADALAEITPTKRKSTKTPPPSRSRATSVTDPSFVPAGLPAHLTSRSSRFSFQVAGNDSTQEKILEDRHKKKAAENASKQQRISTNTIDDEYDEYDMDNYDMDGGYEEEIPMLGDDGDFGDDTMSPGMAAFDFSSLSMPVSNMMNPIGMNGEAQTPLDANGNAIGFAMSHDMFQKTQLPSLNQPLQGSDLSITNLSGLGMMDAQGGLAGSSRFTPTYSSAGNGITVTDEPPPGKVDLGEDFDFDDGLIDEQGDHDAEIFDEAMFDDPSGPFFDRKMKPAPVEEPLSALSPHPPEFPSAETGYDADDDELTRYLDKSEPSLVHQPSRARPVPDLTNLDTYHSALADAANRAEAEGRFMRKASVDVGQPRSDMDDASSLSNSRPSLIPDDDQFSRETTGFPPDDDGFGMSSSFVDDYDYSEYDSALEDDPMIAAANAEALANDAEGFYGSEFGFYASAQGQQGEAVNAWGGYFGSSNLGRSISGRNAMREPNLTPITERSEYSTRNSFISLNHFRDSSQALTSPALAQLARISPYGWPDDDPDLSLNSLMKLRKNTFGGSSISLSSTGNSPRNSSPMGMQFIPRATSPMLDHRLAPNDSSDDSAPVEDSYDEYDEDALDAINAFPDGYEDDDEEVVAQSRPESPTLTASDYNALSSPTWNHPANTLIIAPAYTPPTFKVPPGRLTLSTSFVPPHRSSIDTNMTSSQPSSTVASVSAPRRQSLVSPISTSSPLTPGGGWKVGHSRKGSGADSVTYVREHDDAGGDRWVLERRRTAESGELELVGREIVESGRI
jgi:hypothetical protein